MAATVAVPEWKVVQAVADDSTGKLSTSILIAWESFRTQIGVDALAESLSRYGVDNLNWTLERSLLTQAMVPVAGDIAREVAMTLLPRYQTVAPTSFTETEKFYNPYHDRLGRFASSPGGGSLAGAIDAPRGTNTEVIEALEKLPPDTIIKFYHGTTGRGAKAIVEGMHIRRDDVGAVGLASDYWSAEEYSRYKVGYGRHGPRESIVPTVVLEVAVRRSELGFSSPMGQRRLLSHRGEDRWMSEEIGGSGHNAILVNGRGFKGIQLAGARIIPQKKAPKWEPYTEKFADWMDLAFDLRYMSAEDFLSRYLPRMVVNISEETRRAIRDVVLDGFRKGKHPYQMAEEIKVMVGMTPGQVRAYQAFAANLARGKLPGSGQELALGAYRDRAIERRARNIARTETIRAANAGQMALWQTAEANGLLGPGAKRMWIATPGERTCPSCHDMDGKTTGVNSPWSFEGFGISAPPLHPSCRCAMGMTFEGDNLF